MKQKDPSSSEQKRQGKPSTPGSHDKSDRKLEHERRERIKAQWEEHERESPSSHPRHDKLPLPD